MSELASESSVNVDSSTKEWATGDFVWAKLQGFPAWPARISSREFVPHDIAVETDEQKHLVLFFGDLSYCFVPAANCSTFPGKNFAKLKRSHKSKAFRNGLLQAMAVYRGEETVDEKQLAEKRRLEAEAQDKKAAEKKLLAAEKRKAKKAADRAKSNAEKKTKSAASEKKKKSNASKSKSKSKSSEKTKLNATKKKKAVKAKRVGTQFATKERYPRKESIALKTMRKLGLCPPSASMCSQYPQYAGFDERYARAHKRILAS